MKSGRDEAARGSIPGSSPRPDREHRKPQPTTCYTVVCVKTAVEISEESQKNRSTRGWKTPCNVWYCVLGSGGKGWRFDQNLRGPASWRLPALPGSCSSSSSRRSCGIGNGSDSGMRPCGRLERELIDSPDKAPVIEQTGGLRKLRLRRQAQTGAGAARTAFATPISRHTELLPTS